MKWSSKGTSPFDNDCQTWSLNFLFPERKQAQFFHFSTFFRIPAIRISSPSARVWIRQRTSSPKTMLLCEKKTWGKNETVSETSTRLPIKHFRKKLVQKILNGFGHTDVREIMLSKKFVCILIELRVHKRNEHQVWLFTVSWSFGDNKILPAEELILTKNKKFRDQINFRNQTCSN